MKKFLTTLTILIVTLSFCNTAQAQNVSVNINIGNQPAWGPTGYDYAGYYYFPDIDVYYNVNSGFYNYHDRGRWVSARYLPSIYANYDLYGLYKVVLNVNDPWLYNTHHRRDYARYKGYSGQNIIRDSRDRRYYASRNNRVEWRSNNNHTDRRKNNYNSNYYNNREQNRREANRGNNENTRPNNNLNNHSNYNSNSHTNQARSSKNNHSQRNEGMKKNNKSENSRSNYTSINYNENRTKTSNSTRTR